MSEPARADLLSSASQLEEAALTLRGLAKSCRQLGADDPKRERAARGWEEEAEGWERTAAWLRTLAGVESGV